MKKFVIVITRTCGCGGTSISKIISDDLGISMYDREILKIASVHSGIDQNQFEKVDETVKNSLLYRISKRIYKGELILPESDNFDSDVNLFNYQAEILKKLAEEESYICIGRAADYVLKGMPHVFKILLYAPEAECISKEMIRLNITREEATKKVKKMNKFRSEYYKYHTGRKWLDMQNYDLCLNTSNTSYKKCADMIENYVFTRMKNE